MASAVACTLSNRFAAVAQVAGIMDFGADCVPADPAPLVTFHGTSDEYEPFDGGVENAPARGDLPTDLGGTYDELPVSENPVLELSVPDKVALWAERNGCDGEPTAASIDTQVIRREFTCPDADPVVFYEVENGRHWWGITTGFNTNEHLWEFFNSQSR